MQEHNTNVCVCVCVGERERERAREVIKKSIVVSLCRWTANEAPSVRKTA